MKFFTESYRQFRLMNEAGGGDAGGGGGGAPASSAAAVAAGAGRAKAPEAQGAEEGKQPQGAAAEKAQADPKPQTPKQYKLKVNGKERTFSEEELISRAQLAEAAQERFNEAARLRKQAEGVVGRLRDPKQVMGALMDPSLGLSKEQIRETFEEWYSKEFIEPEQLSPAEKKLREAEEKLKKYQEQEQELQTQKEREAQEAMTAQAREQVQGQIIEALESGKLPKTNFTIRRLAYWMQRNHANGFDAPTDVLIAQVKNEAQTNLRDLVEASDGDVLIQLLGDDVINKIRKFDLDQLRRLRGGGAPQVPQSDEVAVQTNKHGRPPTQAEVQQRIRQMQKTGRY